MDTSKLKKFAQHARRLLLEQVSGKLAFVLSEGSLARRENPKAVEELEKQIAASSEELVIEQAAYTWFNRFCALRFMDANRYTRLGVVSPAEGFLQPEILMDAKQGVIDDEWRVDRERVQGLLDGSLPSKDGQQEAYQLLLIGACNRYHALMPFLFEKIADWTELLIPDDLLSDSSILTFTRQALYPEACEDVEVIGWLYQFYISEKKDDVFAALKKGKKITPENIPAATQLFTPHWIVRYLVENSLGRLWMLNHPESKLVERMEYYIRPEQLETEYLKIARPEEIKVCDPACGSGHMLTYAFDLLYAIYEEQGYQATDIPRLILENNLYGIEIDQRAGALAAFALTMKARDKYKRFLTPGKVTQPNICVLENIYIEPDELSAYMDKVGRDLFSGGLQGVVNQWEEADNFGALIRPVVTDVSEVLELLRERQMGEDLFLAGVHQKVLTALRQADYLSPKYHVVVANPPYMGKKGMNGRMGAFARKEYEENRADLFAMFIQRSLELSKSRGFAGLITMQSWMFLASYEHLRDNVLLNASIRSMAHLGERGFDTIGGAVVSTTAFVIEKTPSSQTGTFLRLVDGQSESEKSEAALAAISGEDESLLFRVSREDFAKITGLPLAYWISDAVRDNFASQPQLEEQVVPKQGLATGDNSRFTRDWHEVSANRITYDVSSYNESCERSLTWVPYSKGGGYRKWYGFAETLVYWPNGGKEIRELVDENGNERSRFRGSDYYFLPAATWGKISSGGFTCRYRGIGYVFDVGGMSAFPKVGSVENLVAILNSPITKDCLHALSSTLNYELGNIAKIPLPVGLLQNSELTQIGSQCIDTSKADWDSFEWSWDFTTLPLLRNRDSTLKDAYADCRTNWRSVVEQQIALEEKSNLLIRHAYGFGEESKVPVKINDVTLTCNPTFRYDADKSESDLESLLLADTMREFISYAVGCMLGRYSLDKPGLILANGGETADDYRQQIPEPTFAPDEDNVIPLLDGDWFEDDITERFKAFLKVTFGEEHYEDNLTFLENALYPDNLIGKKRKTIRDYFLKEFYNHHIKLYKKRPIYWLFSSPKGAFNALVYMHRYRPDTVSVVLNDYLRELQTKLRAKLDHQESVANSGDASKSEKTKALKQITELKKQLKELEDYERDVLFPLASEQIEIDLDDGVKVNYNKFGKALKKITGLTGK